MKLVKLNLKIILRLLCSDETYSNLVVSTAYPGLSPRIWRRTLKATYRRGKRMVYEDLETKYGHKEFEAYGLFNSHKSKFNDI